MNDPTKFAHLSSLHQLYAMEHAEEPEENWVLSYLDVFALIATLFIVLTVLAQLKLEKQVADNEVQQQQLQQSRDSVSSLTEQLSALTAPANNAAIETLPASLQTLMAEQDWDDQVAVTSHDDYTELQIRDRVLFSSAEADLLPEGRALLQRLVPLLSRTQGMIYIEGHTDNQPIDTPRFHSNWELAAARATNVLQVFAESGLPAKRLRAVSVADTDPVASNASEFGRAQNRRVSLLIRKVETTQEKIADR